MPETDTKQLLRRAGLRPTRQRVLLGRLIFDGRDHHFSAETLQKLALENNVVVSLATIYNTLNSFLKAGLLREIPVDGRRTYFDTNTSEHQHFFVEDDGVVMDIGSEGLTFAGVPIPPAGYEIVQFDVVVRLRPARSAAARRTARGARISARSRQRMTASRAMSG